jgi:hypothetical protein
MATVADGAVEETGHFDISAAISIRPSRTRNYDDLLGFDQVKCNISVDQEPSQRRAQFAPVWTEERKLAKFIEALRKPGQGSIGRGEAAFGKKAMNVEHVRAGAQGNDDPHHRS